MIDIPFSEACERNKVVILSTIKPVLEKLGSSEKLGSAENLGSAEKLGSVLEIGSGTAQHALYFASQMPNLYWQTSDQQSYLGGIRAALLNAKQREEGSGNESSLANVAEPIELNVNQEPWLEESRQFDAVYTANTFHIMSQRDVQQFFNGIRQVTHDSSALIVYGPFKYAGDYTSESNANFDASLRSRGVGSGIRDFEWVNDLAESQGFVLQSDTSMPANNQCLIWQRKM